VAVFVGREWTGQNRRPTVTRNITSASSTHGSRNPTVTMGVGQIVGNRLLGGQPPGIRPLERQQWTVISAQAKQEVGTGSGVWRNSSQ